MRGRFVLAAAVAAGTLFACGSDDSGGGSGGAASASSTTTGAGGGGGDQTPPGSCTKPGDKGNNKGVGEYCTPSGGECSDFPEAPLCLASVGQDQWFCTRIGCDATTDCGEGAGCLIAGGMGSACVPCKCSPDGVGCSGTGGAGGGGGAGGAAGGAGGTGG